MVKPKTLWPVPGMSLSLAPQGMGEGGGKESGRHRARLPPSLASSSLVYSVIVVKVWSCPERGLSQGRLYT